MQGLCNGRVSVRLSVSSIDSNSAAVGFAAERGRLQQILIDSWYARSRRSAANAGSVILRAEGRGSTQTCRLRYTLLSVAYRFAHRGGRYIFPGRRRLVARQEVYKYDRMMRGRLRSTRS